MFDDFISRRLFAQGLTSTLSRLPFVRETNERVTGSASEGTSSRCLTHYDGRAGKGDDDTAFLQAFLDSGGGYIGVPSSGSFNITDTLIIPSNASLWGAGSVSRIRMTRDRKHPIVPMIHAPPGTSNITLRSFLLDHDAEASAPPVLAEGNPAMGSCVFFGASFSVIEDLTVLNAWDNGIAIGAVELQSGRGQPGDPNSVVISNVLTRNCGCGEHDRGGHKGKIGPGINITSGANVVVGNCVDFESYSGFGTDTGGGSSASFTNCASWLARADPLRRNIGSGHAFVSQSGETSFIGCKAFFASGYGFWFSNSAIASQATGCISKGAMLGNYLLSGSDISLTGCIAEVAGRVYGPDVSNYILRAEVSDIRGISITGCSSKIRDGVAPWSLIAQCRSPTRGNTINKIHASLIGGDWDTGNEGKFLISSDVSVIAGETIILKNLPTTPSKAGSGQLWVKNGALQIS